MKSLQREAIANLDSFLTNQMAKHDPYRHAHCSISAIQIRMHLSRIDSPLKKFNNDKGEVQLHSHAKSLSILGEKWVNKFIKDQYYVIDLANAKGNSFVKRWYNLRDLKACHFHQIISPSTIVKLNKYLVDNQRFKVDKCTRQINGQITPTEECSEAWSEGWFIRVNVRELCHQLCSISFRTHSGSSYSKQHRNNLAFSELFNLSDWSVYSEEQCKIIQVSIAERELNKEHRRQCEEESFQSRITLAPTVPPA